METVIQTQGKLEGLCAEETYKLRENVKDDIKERKTSVQRKRGRYF